jgi:hypothetical protein
MKLKPAPMEGFEHFLGANGKWRKRRILDAETAKQKKDKLTKKLIELALPARIEKYKNLKEKKKQANEERDNAI